MHQQSTINLKHAKKIRFWGITGHMDSQKLNELPCSSSSFKCLFRQLVHQNFLQVNCPKPNCLGMRRRSHTSGPRLQHIICQQSLDRILMKAKPRCLCTFQEAKPLHANEHVQGRKSGISQKSVGHNSVI
jgi:hypothetical protein